MTIRNGSGRIRCMGTIFYSRPYPPRTIRSYLPAPTEEPTENLVVLGLDLHRHSTRSSGNMMTFRGVRQGHQTPQGGYHHYRYGESRTVLRPVVLDDDAWLKSIDSHYVP